MSTTRAPACVLPPLMQFLALISTRLQARGSCKEQAQQSTRRMFPRCLLVTGISCPLAVGRNELCMFRVVHYCGSMVLDVRPACPLVLNTALQRSETPSTTRCRTHGLQLLPHLLVGIEELGYASVNANALAFAEFAVQVSLVNAF